MFDLGFSELMMIGLVALIVIGPERLPRVARTVGHLVGKLQRYVADVKADINREMELDELRKMRDSVQEAASEVESTVREELTSAESGLNQSIAAATGDVAATGEAAATDPAPAADPGDAVSESGTNPSMAVADQSKQA